MDGVPLLITGIVSVIAIFQQLGLLALYFCTVGKSFMQESSTSAPPTFSWSLWTRIVYACFMFAASAAIMWKEFFRFHWVWVLFFALQSLVYVPMQKGEARKAYYSKPRTIISIVLLIATGAALYPLFTK
jgi:hypothetical protein